MESGYKTFKLRENVWRIEDSMVRCFLVAGSNSALLIDTGVSGGNLKSKIEKLTDLPIILVNTHKDRDHIASNLQFEKCYAHRLDADSIKEVLKFEYTINEIDDGYIFDLGGCKLEVIHIPGHTPGSIALLDRANRFLFSGDSVQDGNIFMFGNGRNMSDFIESLEKLNSMSSYFDIIYPCHSSFEVKNDIIPKLIEGAKNYLDGKLPLEEMDMHGNKVKRCDIGCAAFLVEN